MSNNPKDQKIDLSMLEVDEDNNQRKNKYPKTTRKNESENDNTDEAESEEPSFPIEPAPEVPLDNLKGIEKTEMQEAASIASRHSRIRHSGLSSKITTPIDQNFHLKIK